MGLHLRGGASAELRGETPCDRMPLRAPEIHAAHAAEAHSAASRSQFAICHRFEVRFEDLKT